MKILKAKTLQTLPERPGCYVLRNVFLAFSGLTNRCGRHDGSIQVCICPCGPCTPLHACYIPQDDGINQKDNAKCHTAGNYVRGLKNIWTSLRSPLASKITSIKNLWDHLDHDVRAMDPHPRNLAQLATAQESAWFNITVNTCNVEPN
ncbi:transposable element Tcb1 transposase [Trichonephila clavipes]|uniref:Transposable element Tcb1 transposase n=1 Tax=Trichonephila clavipes TaxID=2585209 RepID=A0A8X6SNG9_TRICX|nr:transposable element Tcb1 transposase [Trichonephila clavipes]